MNLLTESLPLIHWKYFSRKWHDSEEYPGSKVSSCYISDLPEREIPLDRVWDDACDVGFAVWGKHGKRAFVRFKVDRDREGDIAGWWYESIDPKTKRTDGKYKILIIND